MCCFIKLLAPGLDPRLDDRAYWAEPLDAAHFIRPMQRAVLCLCLGGVLMGLVRVWEKRHRKTGEKRWVALCEVAAALLIASQPLG